MNTRQGSVAIYIVLLMLLMMTSTAVVLSGILVRHIRSADNYLKTEQAFSAANEGIEHMLYRIVGQEEKGTITVEAEIEYDNGTTAEYTGTGCGDEDGNPHVTSTGKLGDVVRRIQIGGGDTECS